MEDAAAKKLSFWEQVGSLPNNFWYANLMEIFERLAFFGVRAIAPLYLVKKAGENGLGLSYADKGDIYMWWALIQCLVPMVSGGFTERYGYKKSLVVAFLINIMGYLLMAQSLPVSTELVARGWAGAGYWVFLAAACLIGFGTAIFKPPVHGTIARTTTEETSSFGWGMFYWVVNIGGALAPMAAAELRGEIRWHWVFYGAAIVTACNFLPLFLLYREPEKHAPKAGEAQHGIVGTFVTSIVTICRDLRLVMFLLIFSCFWLMFMQLWDLLPNFIDEWVNTSDVAGVFGFLRPTWVLENGQTKPEILINIDSWSIIALVLFISWVVRKVNKVAAMVIGMVIALVGFVGAGLTMFGWLCCLMIFVFAIGEMMCSPTFSAYVGLIAPPDKKALYMGYSNIPFAIGWAAGNKIGGLLYGALADKYRLARQYLVDQLHVPNAFAGNEEMLPNTHVMDTLVYLRQGGQADQVASAIEAQWAQVDWNAIPPEATAEKVREIYSGVLGTVDHAAVWDATRMLWDMHHPYMVWVYLGIFGVVGTAGMLLFYFATRRETAANSLANTASPS